MDEKVKISDIEEIIGKETIRDIKKIANDNSLDSSRYYTLAEEFKLASGICNVIANLLKVINESS